VIRKRDCWGGTSGIGAWVKGCGWRLKVGVDRWCVGLESLGVRRYLGSVEALG